MFKNKILNDLQKAVQDLGLKSDDPDKIGDDIVCSIPKNSAFGDYTTNIALQLANQKSGSGKQKPEGIAKKILVKLGLPDYLEKAEIAGSGFINFFIKDSAIIENIEKVCNYSAFVNPSHSAEAPQDEKKKIFMEYAQPNTHKEFHLGHTRNINLGESICRLLESQGNEVYRSTYGSDIGLPVAKAIWGIQQLESEFKRVRKKDLSDRVHFLAKAYIKGASEYEENEANKVEVDDLNKKIYEREPKVTKLLEETKKWSIEYFEAIYEKLGIKFDRYFWESEVEGLGSEIVRNNIGKVFIRDQGAIIFPGEKYGLHNRVFLTSAGNPTYEAKDLGLAYLKQEIWPFDLAIILSGSEQKEYFQVMFKALETLDEEFKDKMMNFPFGTVNFATGKKMSSRKGEVVTFDYLFEEVKKAVMEIMQKSSEVKGEEKEQVINLVALGAIKFSMLKYSPTTNIVFDIKNSISLEGDSGPYLQYSYARAKSVLRTAAFDYNPETEDDPGELEVEERLLLRLIEHFESILQESAKEYAPQNLAEYLLDLARSFNLFYQKHPIIKADKSEFRLGLTCAVAVTLKQGLYLLGIEAPERM